MLPHEDQIREASYCTIVDHREDERRPDELDELDIWDAEDDCLAWQLGYWRGWVERGMDPRRMVRVFASIRDTITFMNRAGKGSAALLENIADLHILHQNLAAKLEEVDMLEIAEDHDLNADEPEDFDDDHPEDNIPVAAHGLVKPVNAPGPTLPVVTRQVQAWWGQLDRYGSVELAKMLTSMDAIRTGDHGLSSQAVGVLVSQLAGVKRAYRERIAQLQEHKNPRLSEARCKYPSREANPHQYGEMTKIIAHANRSERSARYPQHQARPPEQFVVPLRDGHEGRPFDEIRGQIIGVTPTTGESAYESDLELTSEAGKSGETYRGLYQGGISDSTARPAIMAPVSFINRAKAIGLDVESLVLDGRSLLAWHKIHTQQGPRWDERVAGLFAHAMRIEEEVFKERGVGEGANKPDAPVVDRCPKCNGTGNMGFVTHSPCDEVGCTIVADAAAKSLADARNGPAREVVCAEAGGWPASPADEAIPLALGEAGQTSASLGWPIDKLQPRSGSAGPAGR